MNCVFCQIVDGTVPCEVLYADEQVIAFNDLHPQAPLHQLIIPKQHIETLNHITPAHSRLLGHMVSVAQKLAQQAGVAEPDKGYRLVMNCDRDGGQTVFHIHLHLLAGRALTWPPG